MIRTADRMAATLHQAGVRHAFGMPGGEVTVLVDALAKAGVDFVLARNETAAAMMAAGTCVEAQLPGLLVTTIGPGLANAVNGIADAMQERTPLIVLSGTIEEHLRGRYTHQVVDHRQLLAPVVKASFEIAPETASAVVARAIRLAMTHPCGPVHIDLSPSMAVAESREMTTTTFVRSQAPTPDPSSSIVREIRDRLASAQRPIILAGLSAARAAGAGRFTSLIERAGIPVLTTYKAKGLIDENHPLSISAAGLSPRADAKILPLLRQSDLILLLGYDPIEMRASWLDPVDDPARVIDIGPDHDQAMHLAGLRIEADPIDFLSAVLVGLPERNLWPNGEPHSLRAALRLEVADWGPLAVFETLQQSLAEEAIVSVDSGAHRILLSQHWRCSQPFGLVQSAGWCTMGSALPLAIGRKLSDPQKPAVAVLGDGGLEMTLGELGTIHDRNLRITVVVLQDQSLELIGMKQDQAGLERRAIQMGATDYAQVASAFGGHGVCVRSVAELRSALEEADRQPGFTLISCAIPGDAYGGLI